MQQDRSTIHLDLDGAWDSGALGIATQSLREWGPQLRYTAPANVMSTFNRALGQPLAPFVLYGSGDFHHLASVFVQRGVARGGDVHLVSFDNHPDWDVRPPAFGCGGWINRALEMPGLQTAAVWGCGNFELRFPARLFANRKALTSGRLQINAWAERQPASVSRRFDCMTRENWRERFEAFAHLMAGKNVYVTIDLDCIAKAMTNWETGLFEAEEIAWAVGILQDKANIVGGDVCGAFSPPAYARFGQRLAGWWDHPKLPVMDMGRSQAVNLELLQVIWPALTRQSLVTGCSLMGNFAQRGVLA